MQFREIVCSSQYEPTEKAAAEKLDFALATPTLHTRGDAAQ